MEAEAQTWTLTVTIDSFLFLRSDGLAGYKVYRENKWHAEQWYPFIEDGNIIIRDTPEKIRDWFENWLEAQGHTVT
jgi:hypothetical protein